jgi:hypothetical protein
MADMLGSGMWGRWSKKCKRVGCCLTPRRSKSGQRHHEEKLWRTKDQEMPYYWHPRADIEEDYEGDPDPRDGPAGWAWRILQGETEEDSENDQEG